MKRFFFVLLVALTGLTPPTLHAQIVTDLVLFAPPTPEDADHTSSTVVSLTEVSTWIRQAPTGKTTWVAAPGTVPILMPSEAVNGNFLKANGPGIYQLFYTVGGAIHLEEIVVN